MFNFNYYYCIIILYIILCYALTFPSQVTGAWVVAAPQAGRGVFVHRPPRWLDLSKSGPYWNWARCAHIQTPGGPTPPPVTPILKPPFPLLIVLLECKWVFLVLCLVATFRKDLGHPASDSSNLAGRLPYLKYTIYNYIA